MLSKEKDVVITDITDDVVVEVLDKIVARHKEGMIKFGVSMADNKLGSEFWIDQAIEESIDFIHYLTKLKRCLNDSSKL